MKAYVVEFGSMLQDPRRFEVRYGLEPNSQSEYASRKLAEAAIEKLNRFEVRVGAHHCAFTVDALPDGMFGVFCVCHPLCTPANSSVFSLQELAIDPKAAQSHAFENRG